MVNTARDNYKGFTSAENKGADAAYTTLVRLGNPTVDDFEKMVCANQIQNFPITSKDITNAKVVFSTHLAGVRGKAERRTPKLVDSDSVEIPRDFQLFHKYVTLVVDVFFLNGIPFFYYAIQEASLCEFQHACNLGLLIN